MNLYSREENHSYIWPVAGCRNVLTEKYRILLYGSDDFIDTYQVSLIEGMRSEGATKAEIDAKKEELQYYAEIYENPFWRILIKLGEILHVGLLISLISAALLRNSSFMAAPENVLSEYSTP